jgi:hypothetical protein
MTCMSQCHMTSNQNVMKKTCHAPLWEPLGQEVLSLYSLCLSCVCVCEAPLWEGLGETRGGQALLLSDPGQH